VKKLLSTKRLKFQKKQASTKLAPSPFTTNDN
jgi:hypothetical protein